MQYQFTTYKLPTGWYWQVTKDVGPAIFVVARSGHAFPTEEAAKQSYKDFIKWASGHATPPASN